MRRLVDLLLIAAILTAVGFGAYVLGQTIDSTSSNLAKHDSELNQNVYRHTQPKKPSRRTIELVAVSVGGAIAVMVLVSVTSTALRTRRRERWRAV